jgi:hypothetical protein
MYAFWIECSVKMPWLQSAELRQIWARMSPLGPSPPNGLIASGSFCPSACLVKALPDSAQAWRWGCLTMEGIGFSSSPTTCGKANSR